MKKYALVLLCLVLSLCLAIPALADGTANTTCITETTELNPGDEVVITVNLADSVELKSMGLALNYDAEIFELTSACEWLVSGLIANVDHANNTAAFVTTTAADFNGAIFTFTLKVKETAALGETEVSVTGILKDATMQDVECLNNVLTLNIVCAHENQSEIPAVEATCSEAGLTAGTKCDDCEAILVEQTVVPATGDHDYATETDRQEPTCTVDGYVVTVCACGAELETVLPATGHGDTEIVDAVDATCGTDGYTGDTYCLDCEEKIADGEVILATGEHVYATETDRQEATCTVDGYVITVCGCGAELETILPATGHGETEISGAADATCGTDGYTGDTYCLNCEEKIAEGEVILATGEHVYVTETERQEATCAADGYIITVCGCGAELETILPATGHTWIDATCIAPKTCEVCGETEGEPVSFAHKYGEWEVVIEPTVEAGLMQRVCALCGGIEEAIIPPAHVCEFTKLTIAATCTEYGFDLYVCEGCSLSYADNYIAALGHAFSEATCTEAATCERCGETEGELAAHNITSSSEGFEASCLEEGIVEYYYCGDCNTYFADAECTVKMEDQTGLGLNIPMTGHNITSSCEGFEASCLEEGMLEYYYCGDCNTYFADAELTTELEDQTGANLVIPMTGHNITVSCEGFAATCTEEGMLEYYYCGDCNTYFADAELTTKLEDQTGKNLTIAVGAHTEGEWVVVKEAAIGVDGLKELRCTVCGEVLATEVIPALENSPETGSVMFFVVAAFGVVAMIGATVVIGKKKYF